VLDPFVRRTYLDTLKRVPAYRSYLKQKNCFLNDISGIADFKKLPIMDKSSYIQSFALAQLFPDSQIPLMGHSSSGSSGKTTFWFRGPKQEAIGAEIIHTILNKIFRLDPHSRTLVIISFAMGVWVAGGYTLLACNHLFKSQDYRFSLLTPGGEINDTLGILQNIAPYFDNVVLFGYPPLISKLFSEAKTRNIPLHKSCYIVSSGANPSEAWRDSMLEHLRLPDSEQARMISLYGSADGGILAHETPLSIAIHRLANKHQPLRERLFGSDSHYLPLLAQYHPDKIYFESIDEELVLTANLDLPLIRYNIKDRGAVFTPDQMLALLTTCGLDHLIKHSLFQEWTMPFVTVKGRSDVAVNFNCAKISVEFLVDALQSQTISKYLSGCFLAYTTPIPSGEVFHIDLELSEKTTLSHDQEESIALHIFSHLRSVCSEYNDVCKNIGKENAFPQIHYQHFGARSSEKDLDKKHSKILGTPGKKPRVLL